MNHAEAVYRSGTTRTHWGAYSVPQTPSWMRRKRPPRRQGRKTKRRKGKVKGKGREGGGGNGKREKKGQGSILALLFLLPALGRVKCKLALRSLAAYLLNGLQRSSNAAVYKADINKDGGR